MKTFLAVLTVSALALSLAACGGAGKNDPSGPDTSDTAARTTQTDEATTEATEAPETEQPEDDSLVEELTNRLTGVWGYPGDGSEDLEQLTFNADGTGSYKGLEDRQFTFTYAIHIDHRTYGNGAPYTESMIKIDYDNGETEDNIFFFNENGQLAFHNSENGGYNGLIYFLDVFTKE